MSLHYAGFAIGKDFISLMNGETVVLLSMSKPAIAMPRDGASDIAYAILKMAGCEQAAADGGFSAGDMADAAAKAFRDGQAAEHKKYAELIEAARRAAIAAVRGDDSNPGTIRNADLDRLRAAIATCDGEGA